jgi:lysozyme family protein
LTYGDAKQVYRELYWEPSKASEMSGFIRDIYFDMVINHGQKTAVRIIQQAANQTGQDISVDGLIGPKTLNAAPHLERIDVVNQRLLFYTDIQLGDHSQRKFAAGWYRKRCLIFLSR